MRQGGQGGRDAMNMHLIDWVIVAAVLSVLILIVTSTRKHMHGVSGFLAADRCGGRYLLCISEGIAGLGAVTLLAFWQQYTKTGFTGIWWSLPNWPLLFVLALSGWVLYRYRQTRALTLAQFLEMRYSRNFRVYAGMLAFLSGVINYGVFPGLNARLFIHFCGLPEQFDVAGAQIPTFPVVMALLLGLALFFTFMGGQIAIMLSNFFQGVLCMIVLVVAALVVYVKVGWPHIGEGLATAPANQSLVNPFKTSEIEGFNMWFFLIQYFLWFYQWKAWQGTQAYNASAKTPHEAKMAQILGMWRYFAQEMLVPIFAICALAFLVHADFASEAASVKQTLAQMGSEKLQTQMTVPIVLGKILPVGIMGALTVVILAAAVSTDESYLHSWGSIFIQDVVMPLRRTPLSPEAHLWCLRLSICGVALFAFVFSMYFSMTDYIRMFFAVTGAIYLGGAGCCIIGGLYTRLGTTTAAWAVMIVAPIMAVVNILCGQIVAADPAARGLMPWLQSALYPLGGLGEIIRGIGRIDGQVASFHISAAAIATYVLVSLLSYRGKFDLDRMLHRGRHAVAEDIAKGGAEMTGLAKWLGITRDFTPWDKVIYYGSVGWMVLWAVVFALGVYYHYLITEIPDALWSSFWRMIIWLALILGFVVTVWFLIGGVRDVKEMIHLLRTRVQDETDDGRVVHEEEV